MRSRKHHNNTGRKQIRNGSAFLNLLKIGKKMGVKVVSNTHEIPEKYK